MAVSTSDESRSDLTSSCQGDSRRFEPGVPLRPYGSRGRSHARERRLLLLLQVVFSVRLFADQSEVRPRGLDGVGFPGEPHRWDLDARFELAARLPATESELLAGIVDHHPFVGRDPAHGDVHRRGKAFCVGRWPTGGVTLPSGAAITYVIDGQDRRIGKKVNGV